MEGSHNISAWIGNAFSAGAIVGTLVGWLPAAAALVGLIWYLIQIYESQTAQRWLASRRARKIARLKQRLHTLQRPDDA